MGNIINPSDRWDSEEKDNERFRRRRPRRPKRFSRISRRPVTKCYIGFGHTIVSHSDGMKELVVELRSQSRLFYLKMGNYTDDGFPKYS